MISFHPHAGAVLICDYDTGFIVPEMVKRRLCVVISPRRRRGVGLCTVVPLSTTDPEPALPHHVNLQFTPELPKPWQGARRWAKCDMVATVSHARLSPIGIGRGPNGSRRYIYPDVGDQQLARVRAGVLHALGLSSLTPHL